MFSALFFLEIKKGGPPVHPKYWINMFSICGVIAASELLRILHSQYLTTLRKNLFFTPYVTSSTISNAGRYF